MQKQISSKIVVLTFGILVICFTVGFYVLALWQEPSQEAPEGNAPTPVNTGTQSQSKAGMISATVFGDADNPDYYLNPSGNSRVGGDLEAEGKITGSNFPPLSCPEGSAIRAINEDGSVVCEGAPFGEGGESPAWNRIYTGVEPDYHHTSVIANDGSLVRLRISPPVDAGKLYYQRVTNPGPGSSFSDWTYISQYNVSEVASCVRPQTAQLAQLFIKGGSRAIYFRESDNNGSSWGSWQLIDYAPSYGLGFDCAYKPNGDMAFFFADQSTLYVKKRLAGAWQSKASWDKTTDYLSGVAVVYDNDWNILLMGKNASGNYRVWTFVYGDGGDFALGAWSNLIPIISATSSQYAFSHVFMDKSDIYRAIYTEEFVPDNYYRPYYIEVPTSAGFFGQYWSSPEQFDSLSTRYSLDIASRDNLLWASNPYGVWQAEK